MEQGKDNGGYLNIAETGKGVFGVEAAAQKYFGRSAAKLSTREAVSIACVLPDLLKRNPMTVSQKNKSKYNITYKRTERTPYPRIFSCARSGIGSFRGHPVRGTDRNKKQRP